MLKSKNFEMLILSLSGRMNKIGNVVKILKSKNFRYIC